MQPGPKPQPTAYKIARGNPGKRRIDRQDSLAIKVMPEPPEHLIGEARKEWDRVSERLYSVGCLSATDAATLAAYCQLYARWVQSELTLARMAAQDQISGGLLIMTKNGNFIQNPILGVINRTIERMTQLAAEFGMTPSARARLFNTMARKESMPDQQPNSKPSAEVEELLEYLGGDSEGGDFGTTH